MQTDNDPRTPSDLTGSGFDSPPIDSELPDRWPESSTSAEPLPTALANEIAADASAVPPAEPAPRRLTYLSAFRYVFENPDWFSSMVFGTIFSFLPVLGPVALWGYSYEIIEALHRRPNVPYPKFEFKRLGEYCMRGVWPYILALTVETILGILFQVVYQVVFQGGLMLWMSNQQAAAIVTAIVAPILVGGGVILAVGVAVGTGPFLIRAGLTQDFRQVFHLAWIKGYWKRVWPEQILAYLFIMAATTILRPLGCLLFGVGFFAAYFVLWIAASHLQWQIYEIYLERGGEPIPLHPLPAEAPPVQVDDRP